MNKAIIIKATPTDFTEHETLLKTHGWEVLVSQSLRDSISHILINRPNIVYISLDYDSQRISKLIRFLPQFVTCTVIPFSESNTNSILIKSLGSKYTIAAHATPENFLAVATQYLNDSKSKPSISGFIFSDKIFVSSDGQINDQGKRTVSYILSQVLSETHETTDEVNPAQVSLINLKKSISSTLEELFVKEKDSDHKIANKQSVTCINMKSKNLNGIIVMSKAQDKTISNDTSEKIRESLTQKMNAHGEAISSSHPSEVNITEVPLNEWLHHSANYVAHASLDQNQLTVAYFNYNHHHTYIENQLQDSDMFPIRTEDLYSDRSISFNVFLYLAANQKYVLYTPSGSFFYQNQMDKLKRQGIVHLFVMTKEKNLFNQYINENFLNTKIQLYSDQKNESTS